ncbi:MAG: hypothetical protein ACOC5T_00050 [Elusimicrobiota bacterium]
MKIINKIIVIILALSYHGCVAVKKAGKDTGPKIRISPTPLSEKTAEPRYTEYNIKFEKQMFYIIHSYLLSVGGLWPWQKEFKDGEWTKWEINTQNNEPFEAELALLKTKQQNKKWWRLAFYPENQKEMIYEVLINHNDYSFERIKVRYSNTKPHEVPVYEDLNIRKRPKIISEESLKDKDIIEDKIRVPAGAFKTGHIIYDTGFGVEKLDIWTNEKVPGGVIKYRLGDENEASIISSLLDYGSGARSILDSF